MATEHAKISGWQDSLLPTVVDNLAKAVPDELFGEYPISQTTYDEGFHKITYKSLANAVNGVAWWLKDTIGKPEKEFEVLAYIGHNDVLYLAVILGAVKAGYVAFLPSPRNSLEAQSSLFDKLKCKKLLSPEQEPSSVTSILDHIHMDHLTVPSISDLLDKEYPHFPYDKTYPEAASDPLLIIHTSGSTGIPKPLVYTVEIAHRQMNTGSKDPPSNTKSFNRMWQGKKIFCVFPPFHGACLQSQLFNVIPFGGSIIVPLSGVIPSAQGLVDAMHKTKVEVGFLVPSIVNELSQDSELLDYAGKNLEFSVFGGGDLPQAVGDIVVEKMLLGSLYGMTEFGIAHQLLPEGWKKSDWKYIACHPCMGTVWEEAADGSSELVIKRNADLEANQASFILFPDLEEYRTNDLWTEHPEIKGLWKWIARADDIIVFLNGEKTNPISMEQHIMAANPDVTAALVAGAQRFQACLLVEAKTGVPLSDTSEEAAFVEKIWPSVEEANKEAPAHARVEKSMILPMSPSKPAIRAGKGTVQKPATLKLYAEEIDRLYKNADVGDDHDMEQFDNVDSLDGIAAAVRESVGAVTEVKPKGDDDDLFKLGLDSLQALKLMRRLRKGFELPKMGLTTIYSNSSIAKIAQAVSDMKANSSTSAEAQQELRTKAMTEILDEGCALIKKIEPPSSSPKNSSEKVFVLTGSTGGLGTHTLHALLADPAVVHVYCINRRDNSEKAQRELSKAAGYDLSKDSNRTTFLKGDLTKEHFGLGKSVFEKIRDTATSIMHNAWPVNFNLGLDSFKPHLDGLVNLFELSAAAPHQPKIFFVSSIGSVMTYYDENAGETPEKVLDMRNTNLFSGYAESKWLGEMLCDEAAKQLGLRTAFARVGQIAGAVEAKGIWNPVEWVPSLVVSSLDIGALPESLGKTMDNVNWVPVDLLAKVFKECAEGANNQVNGAPNGTSSEAGADAFHFENPHITAWSSLTPVMASAIKKATGKHIDIVPSDKWLSMLRTSLDDAMQNPDKGEMEALLGRSPALKLLDFYTGIMGETQAANALQLKKTCATSRTLRDMDAVNGGWAEHWVEGWMGNAGYVKHGH